MQLLLTLTIQIHMKVHETHINICSMLQNICYSGKYQWYVLYSGGSINDLLTY